MPERSFLVDGREPLGPSDGRELSRGEWLEEFAIDRRRARVRLGSNRPRVDDMDDISFRDDLFALTELCTYALQSLDRAEAQRLGGLLRQLRARDELPERVRVEMFCLELRNWIGERALEAAVDRLSHIRHRGAALAHP